MVRAKQMSWFSASRWGPRQARAQKMLSLHPGKPRGSIHPHGSRRSAGTRGDEAWRAGRGHLDDLPQAVLRPGSLWRETGHCEATSPLDSIVLQQLLPSTFSLPPTKGPSCPDSWRSSCPPTSRDRGLLLLALHCPPLPLALSFPERECGLAWSQAVEGTDSSEGRGTGQAVVCMARGL